MRLQCCCCSLWPFVSLWSGSTLDRDLIKSKNCESATETDPPFALIDLGGAFENADFSADWWNVFEQSKITKERLLEVTKRVSGNRPEVVTKSVTVHDYVEMRPEAAGTLLPLDIALRIAAIRETFEETGRFDH